MNIPNFEKQRILASVLFPVILKTSNNIEYSHHIKNVKIEVIRYGFSLPLPI